MEDNKFLIGSKNIQIDPIRIVIGDSDIFIEGRVKISISMKKMKKLMKKKKRLNKLFGME